MTPEEQDVLDAAVKWWREHQGVDLVEQTLIWIRLDEAVEALIAARPQKYGEKG